MFFWQRKEIMTTYSLKEYARIKDSLAANGIPYESRTVSNEWNRGMRRNIGASFLKEDAMTQYILYVKKEDAEKAQYLLNKGD